MAPTRIMTNSNLHCSFFNTCWSCCCCFGNQTSCQNCSQFNQLRPQTTEVTKTDWKTEEHSDQDQNGWIFTDATRNIFFVVFVEILGTLLQLSSSMSGVCLDLSLRLRMRLCQSAHASIKKVRAREKEPELRGRKRDRKRGRESERENN